MIKWTCPSSGRRTVLVACTMCAPESDSRTRTLDPCTTEPLKAEEVTSVGVIGAGVMGSGIVEVCARAGLRTVFLEAEDEFVSAGRQRIERALSHSVDPGKLGAQGRGEVLGRISGTT